MSDNYESMRNEIRRLHQVCRAKDQLLNEAANALRMYQAFFAGKISSERHKEYSKIIDRINESVF